MLTVIFRSTVVALLLLASPHAHAETNIKLSVVSSPWSPYVSRDLPGNGLAISIVMTALQRAGYEPTFSLLAWPEDLEGTQQGRYDVIGSLWYTEERNRDLIFSQPIVDNQVKLMVRADSDIRIPELSAISKYKVGVVEDYDYTQGAYEGLAIDFIKANSVEENLQRLLAGDIDVAVADERVALYVLNNQIPGGIKEIRFVEQEIASRGLRIAVSRGRSDAEQIVARFDAEIQTMKDDGTYLDILHQYHVSP
jgi:polar amino acid transport system substrate-binding protein